ncbi:hypothetical protein ABT160_12685 [Streptomyces sp. NPDC001941]|uniref:hypothetical protein n=1 Tax=Streptomyces sp. NPDC001941 TaxID=3154659 RepID=UPI0033315D8C
MHGPAAPPPKPRDATLIALRVVFVAMTVLSCGLLGWAPMLRLAYVTRRALHWALFGLAVALNIAFVVFVAMAPVDSKGEIGDRDTAITMVWLLGGVVFFTAYYLVADLQHQHRQAALAGRGWPAPHYGYPPQAPTLPSRPGPPVPGHGYGYPPQAAPAAAHPTPAPAPPQAPPPQPPAGPPHPRIDQVRAELDELSDLLRGDRPDHGDGRA